MKLIILLLFILLSFGESLHAQYGKPVISFAQYGYQKLRSKLGPDMANDIVLQADGKIILAGYAKLDGYNTPTLMRLLADGTPDNSFGVNGLFVLNLYGNAMFNAVTVQSDGKILAAGYRLSGGSFDVLIARVNADGTRDNGFGSSGYRSQSFSTSDDRANAIGLQSDGKIIISGTSNDKMFAARFTATGALDNTFGNSGSFFPYSGTSESNCLKVLADNSIYIAGSNNDDAALVKLTASGAAATFGSSGKFTYSLPDAQTINAIAVLSDGDIILAGKTINGSYNDVLLVSVKSTGTVETNFYSSGYRTHSIQGYADDYAEAIISLADNSFIISGGSGDKILLSKYDNSGFSDAAFGTNGVAELNLSEGNDIAYGIARSADGSLYLGGMSNDNHLAGKTTANAAWSIDFASVGWAAYPQGESEEDRPVRLIKSQKTAGAYYGAGAVGNGTPGIPGLVRIHESGQLDLTFGVNGVSVIPGGDGLINDIAEQADGKLIALSNNSLYRINEAGQLDLTFGTSGEVVLPSDWYSYRSYYKITRDNSGNIFVTGVFHPDPGGSVGSFFILKLLSDGSVDNSFGSSGFAHISYPGGQGGSTNMVIVQPDGKILLSGTYTDGTRFKFFVARVLADGTIDNNFGSGGQFIPDYNGEENYCKTMFLQPDGKILLGGGTSSDFMYFNYIICRVNPDGTIDNNFGTNGYAKSDEFRLYSTSEGLNAITMLPGGKIIVGGPGSAFVGNNLAPDYGQLAALTADGTWDTDFEFGTFDGNCKVVNDVLIAADGNILALGKGSFVFAKFGGGQTTLPLTLLSFTGNRLAGTHLLKWAFEDAVNVKHFEIEQGNISTQFRTIKTIAYTGGRNYEFATRQYFTGNNFYRLKIVDEDGSYEYSNVILLAEDNIVKAEIYPIPASNRVTLETGKADGTVSLFDMQGRRLLLQKVNNTITQLDISQLPAGVYSLKYQEGNNIQTQQLIKQ